MIINQSLLDEIRPCSSWPYKDIMEFYNLNRGQIYAIFDSGCKDDRKLLENLSIIQENMKSWEIKDILGILSDKG